METSTAMDVEEQPSSSPINLKRFGLKNSIQTNFGDDYVFQIVPKYVPLIFCSYNEILLKLFEEYESFLFYLIETGF